MKGKHSQQIILIAVIGFAVLGVLSENDGASVTITADKPVEKASSDVDQKNIAVDPGGKLPDQNIPPGESVNIKDVQLQGQPEQKDKEIVREVDHDTKPSPDQVDEKGKLDDTPVSTTTDNGHGDVVKTTKPDEEEVLLPPGDIQKNTEEIPKSDDPATPTLLSEVRVDNEVPGVTVQSDPLTVSTTTTSQSGEAITEGSEVGEDDKGSEKQDTDGSMKDRDETAPVDPEFQTFTEFFEENKQAEEEKKKHSKLTDMPGTDVHQIKQKRVVNVASRECGAKIISSNPEAENSAGILTSNKDDYMINPCKAVKKWFVVELCEPARVKSLEVASFELFSSQPHTFRVQFSEGYPTKDWQTMEPFHAKEARAIQTIAVPEDFNDYVKFVRVEMLDHFGEEHFCPLTIFRVLGVLVEYDAYMGQQIDDSATDLDTAMLSDIGEDLERDSDGPKNLFASATDTVIKMVKKVLNVGDKVEMKDLTSNGTAAGNDTRNASLPNNVTDEGYLLPCVPQLREESLSTLPDADEPSLPLPSDTATVDQSHTRKDEDTPLVDVDPEVKDKTVSMVTKLEDHEQIPSNKVEQPLVILLDNEETRQFMTGVVAKCLTKAPRKNRRKKKKLNSTRRATVFCNYIQILFRNARPGTCTVQGQPAVKPVVEDKQSNIVLSDSSIVSLTKDMSSETTKSSSTQLTQSSTNNTTNSTQDGPASTSQSTLPAETVVPDKTVTESEASLKPSSSSAEQTVNDVVVPSVAVPSAIVSTVSIEPTRVVPQEDISASVDLVTSMKTDSSDEVSQEPLPQGEVTLDPSIASAVHVSTTQTTPALDSIVKTQVEEGASSGPSDTPVVDTKEIGEGDGKSKDEHNISSTEGEAVPTVTTQPMLSTSDSFENFDSDAEVISSMVEKLASAILDDPDNGQSRTINDSVMVEGMTPKNSGSAQKDLGLVNVKVPVLSYSKREIALMRLANRINALEMNVTLSIRFLERMSQKFKTKSDEMLKALNKTDTKFEASVMEANDKSKNQQEQMNDIEIRLKNLTLMVHEMVQNMDTLNQKVTDRQMVWTSVEVFILIVIFMVCLRRGKSPSYIPMPPEVQKFLDNIPKEMDLSAIPNRRNSFHGTIRRSSTEIKTVGGALQKYNSETALSCNTQDFSSFDPSGTTLASSLNQQQDLPKRKKKKKKSPDSKSPDLSTDLGGNVSMSEPHTAFNSAGLLFGGASQGDPYISEISEKLNRTSSHSSLYNLPSDQKLAFRSETDITSGTSSASKGQGSKVNIPLPSSDASVSGMTGKGQSWKVKAQSFTNELADSVISGKPPKGPGAQPVGGKSKRGSPPIVRSIADPGGGGASKKKRHSYSPGVTTDSTSPQSPCELETIGPNINGNHIPTAPPRETTALCTHQHKPKKKSHSRTSSADLSSPSGNNGVRNWKNLIGLK